VFRNLPVIRCVKSQWVASKICTVDCRTDGCSRLAANHVADADGGVAMPLFLKKQALFPGQRRQ